MADQRQQGVPDPRAAVRKGAFERFKGEFSDEMGWRTGEAVSLAVSAYHAQYVAPLEERIEALEASWWKRLWRKG